MKYNMMEAAERAEVFNAEDNLARKDKRRKAIQHKQMDKGSRGQKKTVSQKRRQMQKHSVRFEQLLDEYEEY